MVYGMASIREKLHQWECRLVQDVGEGDLLLGELGYTKQHLAEIGDLLYQGIFYRLQSRTIDDILTNVDNQWPLTFALYLVLEGIHHYGDEGQYWHSLKERLKIGENDSSLCGQLFLKVLAKYNLPTFEQSGGYTYVTPILLHGGIPNRFLHEFFDFLYQSEVKPHRIAIDAQTLMTTWRQQADELARLPKPVSRFLQYGGLVAEDFVARCLDLLRITPEIDALGLPERVENAYRTWQERQTSEIRPSRSPIRLQRPVLTVAPYTTGVTLYLPPQQIPSQEAPRGLSWRVTDGNHTQKVTTTRQRIENGYRYTATRELLPVFPTEEYVMQLLADEETLQKWVLSGLGTLPLIVFDPFDDYEADALDEQERHRPGERWLLYPSKFSLQASGESRLIRPPQLPESWHGYNLEVWQLAPGELTLLDDNDQLVPPFHIIQEKSRKRPYLDGGELLLPGRAHTDFPLYCGRPPALVIHTTQPQRWRVSVRADGNAQPAGYHILPLTDLPFQRLDDRISLDLAHPQLLGNQPIGKFEITVRGPLGRTYTLGLRGWPPFTIEGHDTLYLAQADEPAHLRIICDPTTKIRPSPPQIGVDLQESWLSENQRKYTLTVEATIQQVTLQLIHETGVSIPLAVPIQRLRWSLHTGLKTDSEKWQTQPFSLFPGGLGQNAELRVMLPLFTDGPQLHVGWNLLDAEGQILRALPPDQSSLQRLVTFPMTEVLGLWREKQETLRWQLEILVNGHNEPVTVDVLYLLPKLTLGEVLYEWLEDTEQVQLTLYWDNPQPGRKELRLWSQDRPWIDTPIATTHLLDTDETLIEWRLPKRDLPAGAYLVEIATYNPWASQGPQQPALDQPNTVLIEPPGLAQHYTEIATLRDRGLADAEQLLTLFVHQCITAKNTNEHHITNQALMKQCETFSLTWLVRWAETTYKLNRDAYKLAQLRMFDEAVVERLAQGDFPNEELERYFQHLRVDKLIDKLHLWVLQSGLRAAPRRRCLELLLCSQTLDRDAFHQVMVALLEDVSDASLLLSEAVTLLKNNPQDAAEYLADQDSQDASELLELIHQTYDQEEEHL